MFFFSCPCWPSVCLPGEMSIPILCSVFNWVVVLLLNFMNSLYIVDIPPLPDIWLAHIFFHSVGCLFILLMVSFAVQLFSLVWSYCFWCWIQKIFSKMYVKGLPLFSSRKLMVSGLTFKSLNQFELIFVCGIREWSSFPNTIYWRNCPFLIVYSWCFRLKLIIHMWVYFRALCTVSLIHMSVLMPVPCCFDYCGLVKSCEIGMWCLQLCCSFRRSRWLFGPFVIPYKL